MEFTIIDYRIIEQSKTIPTHYKIRIWFKGNNPLHKGDLIVNVPGDRWLVVESKSKYVEIIDLDDNTKVRSMLGLWLAKGSFKIEDEKERSSS